MGVKISKRYSYKIAAKSFETCPEFPPSGSHKTEFGIFEILSF